MIPIPPTLRTVLSRLREEGLVDDELLAAEALDAEPEGDPWYLRVLAGGGAWFAAVLFLVFLFSFSAFRSDEGMLTLGLVLLGAALGLHRRARGLFLEQLAFALSLAGQFSFLGGLGQILDWTAAVWALVIVLEAALLFLYPDALHRFVSTLAGVGATAAFFHALDLPDLLHALVFGLAAGSGLLWEREARLVRSRFSGLARPVAYGLAAGLLGVLVLSVMPDVEVYAVTAWWPSTLGLAAALGRLVHRILTTDAPATPPLARALLFAGLLAVALLTRDAPGITAALFVLTLGFHRGDRLLMAFALAFLAVFLGFFYYHMDLTLLAKSLMLIGSGVVLLGVRVALRRRAAS
ncbi:DUF4401 domain-containing protein [Rhodocaloribacter sp.]